MSSTEFDPYTQNVTFLYRDGKTPINASIPFIDFTNIETVSITLNFGAQIGACIIMLFVVLAMTPTAKLRRPSSILHILGLVVCIIRTTLLVAWFTSKFMDFYVYYADDFSDIPAGDYRASIAAVIFSMLLVVVIEAALMNQAWTMVVLWPDIAKYSVTIASALVTLVTISLRIAFTVLQVHSIANLVPIHESQSTVIKTTIIMNAFSICWFCALFNVKLIMHLIQHRGILAVKSSLTPMEVLVMTNGVLMIVPVIFTGLEWGHFQNFEAASLTLTSVALILPLGTVAARRMVRSNNLGYDSNISNSNPLNHNNSRNGLDGSGLASSANRHGSQNQLDSITSTTPLKTASSFTSSRATNSTAAPLTSIMSRCEGGSGGAGNEKRVRRERPDHFDLELGEIDGDPADSKKARVRVESAFEQHEERV